MGLLCKIRDASNTPSFGFLLPGENAILDRMIRYYGKPKK